MAPPPGETVPSSDCHTPDPPTPTIYAEGKRNAVTHVTMNADFGRRDWAAPSQQMPWNLVSRPTAPNDNRLLRSAEKSTPWADRLVRTPATKPILQALQAFVEAADQSSLDPEIVPPWNGNFLPKRSQIPQLQTYLNAQFAVFTQNTPDQFEPRNKLHAPLPRIVANPVLGVSWGRRYDSRSCSGVAQTATYICVSYQLATFSGMRTWKFYRWRTTIDPESWLRDSAILAIVF